MSEVAASAQKAGFDKAAVILLGAIGGIQVSDPVIASTSLVEASSSLQFSAAIQSLAAGISTLALAATVIPGGLIADRFGRRGVLTIALIVSALGQLVTAFGPSTTFYLLGRVIAGMALGVVFGASYGLLREVGHRSLGPAMGLFNAMNLVIAMTFGIVGGALATANWRLSFMVLPILCVICALLLKLLVPQVDRLPGGKVDYPGMILLGLGVVGVLYGVSHAAIDPAQVSCWLPILLGILSFIAFAIVETRSTSPVFPIRLLTHPAFLGAIILGIAWNMGNGAMNQMVANIWQYVQGFNTVSVSVDEMYMALGSIIGSIVAGRLLGKGKLPRTLGTAGLFMIAFGFASMLIVTPTASLALFIPGMLIASFGWMLSGTTQGFMFLNLAPAKYFGPVTSSKVTVGQFGYSFGLSGSSALISMFTLSQVSGKLDNSGPKTAPEWHTITSYLQDGKTSDSTLSVISHEQLAAIYTNSYRLTSLILAIVIVVAGALFYFLMRRSKVEDPVEPYCEPRVAEVRR